MPFMPFLNSGFGRDTCCALDSWLRESLDALRLRSDRGHIGPSPQLLVSSSCWNNYPLRHQIGESGGPFGVRHYRLEVVSSQVPSLGQARG